MGVAPSQPFPARRATRSLKPDPSPIDSLDDALLGSILVRVGFKQGRSTSSVSKRWRHVFFSQPELWQQGLRLTSKPQGRASLLPRTPRSSRQQRSLAALARQAAPVVHHLVLTDRSVGDPCLQACLPAVLGAMEPAQLHSLALHRVPLTGAASRHLVRLTALSELQLSCAGGQEVRLDALAAVARLPSLRRFRLAAERLPVLLPRVLCQLTSLTSLTLETWDRGSLPAALPDALRPLCRLQRLELRSDSFQPPPDILPRLDSPPWAAPAAAVAWLGLAVAQPAELVPWPASQAQLQAQAAASLAQLQHAETAGPQPLGQLTCLVLRARSLPAHLLASVSRLPRLAHLELRSTLPLPADLAAARPDSLTALTGLTCLRLWQRPEGGAQQGALAVPPLHAFPLLRVFSLYSPLIELPGGHAVAFDTGSRFRLGEEQRHHLLMERGSVALDALNHAEAELASPTTSVVHIGVAETRLGEGDLAALLSATLAAAAEPRLHRLSLRGAALASPAAFSGCSPFLAAVTRLSLSGVAEAGREATDASLRDDLDTLLCLAPRLSHLSIHCRQQEGGNAGLKLSEGLPGALAAAVLPGLRTLVVTGAELAELPAGGYLAGLTRLNLEDNRLRPAATLPALQAATKLRALNLAGNAALLNHPQAAHTLAALPALSQLRLGGSRWQRHTARGPPAALLCQLEALAPRLQVLLDLAAPEELDVPFMHPA